MSLPVIDLGPPAAPYKVDLRCGTAHELMIAWRTYADMSEEEVRLLEQTPDLEQKLPAQFDVKRKRLNSLIPSFLLIKLPYQLNLDEAEELLDWLRNSDPREVSKTIFSLVPAFSPKAIEAALQGDFEELKREAQPEALPYVERVAKTSQQELKELLQQTLTIFYEQAIQPNDPSDILKRDKEAKEKTNLAGPELVEYATGGVGCPPQPGLKTVVLIPQLAMRPYNLTDADPGIRYYFYPVADSSITEDPLPGLLRSLKALADESRLRILQQLTKGPNTVTGLVEQLGLAKSTVHHHLVALRSAGFVSLDDINGTYQRTKNGEEMLKNQLTTYLGG